MLRREKDLVDFFSRANVCPTGIRQGSVLLVRRRLRALTEDGGCSLVLNAREQPTGEAIAEFATNEDMQVNQTSFLYFLVPATIFFMLLLDADD